MTAVQQQLQTETINGVIVAIFIKNREDGWSPGHVQVSGKKVSAVGCWGSTAEGTPVTLSGVWVDNPQYGLQFKFTSLEVVEVGADGNDLEFFLALRLPDVGTYRAGLIVQRFGADNVMKMLEEEPERLTEIPGIVERMIPAIRQAWQDYKNELEIGKKLAKWRLELRVRTKAVEKWKATTVDVLEANIFRLMELAGVGFKTADEARLAAGLPSDDPRRVRAGILHVMESKVENEGHTYVDLTWLSIETCRVLELPGHAVATGIETAQLHGDLVERTIRGFPVLFRDETDEAEALIANFVLRERSAQVEQVFVVESKPVEENEDESGDLPFDDEYFEARKFARENPDPTVVDAAALRESFGDDYYEPDRLAADTVLASLTCYCCGDRDQDDGLQVTPCCGKPICYPCFDAVRGSVKLNRERGRMSAPCPSCHQRILCAVNQEHTVGWGPVRLEEVE